MIRKFFHTLKQTNSTIFWRIRFDQRNICSTKEFLRQHAIQENYQTVYLTRYQQVQQGQCN